MDDNWAEKPLAVHRISRSPAIYREADEAGEQPPLAVLQAIAAAGGLPDWFEVNPQEP
ncbi:MAG: hypothetical protein ABSE16_02545 [Verrucomicrobiota bacterium]